MDVASQPPPPKQGTTCLVGLLPTLGSRRLKAAVTRSCRITLHRAPWLCTWAQKGSVLSDFLPYEITSPRVIEKKRKQMKKRSLPGGASKDLTFSYLALTSSLSQSEPQGQEHGHGSIVSLPAFPSQGFAFHLKTKQNKTKVQQANILYVP